VQEYIKHYSRPGDLVCDPFSGSGVTPVEALVLGRRAVASDINPVARFITRMTAVAPIDIPRLQVAFERVSAVAQAHVEELTAMSDDEVLRLLSHLDYPRTPIPRGVRRAGAETVDRLHTVRQLAGLTLLRDAIRQTDDHDLRDLLMVAFGNTRSLRQPDIRRSRSRRGIAVPWQCELSAPLQFFTRLREDLP